MGERTVTTVYLVRHAEAEGNLYRIAHGQYNGLITDRGYQQLHVLKKRFDDVHIDAVYSSDLFRARTTARAVYEPKGLELHLEPAFREIHMGCWEGRPWQELNTAYEEQMFYFNRQLDKFHVEGSETAQQVLDRYIPALKRVAADAGSVQPRRQAGLPARPAHHRLRQPGQGGLPRHAHRHRRVGGVTAAVCPL